MCSSSIQHEAMQDLQTFQEYMRGLLLLKSTMKTSHVWQNYETCWSPVEYEALPQVLGMADGIGEMPLTHPFLSHILFSALFLGLPVPRNGSISVEEKTNNIGSAL